LLIRFYRWLIVVGIILTLMGGLGLLSGFIGLIDLDAFAFGITAGVRVVGTLAITGCLLGAIGCFGLEFNNIPS
jgi:hypothetical protein